MAGHRAYKHPAALVVPAEVNAYQLLGLDTALDVHIKQVLGAVVGDGVVCLVKLQRLLAAALYLPVLALGKEQKLVLGDLPTAVFCVCGEENYPVAETCNVKRPAVFAQLNKYLEPGDFDGAVYQRAAGLLWQQLQGGSGPVNAASVISAFETEREQEAAASILNMHLEGIEDADDRAKTLRELVFFIKLASLERMTQSGGTQSLQDLLSAKQKLQALRTVRFQL